MLRHPVLVPTSLQWKAGTSWVESVAVPLLGNGGDCIAVVSTIIEPSVIVAPAMYHVDPEEAEATFSALKQRNRQFLLVSYL
jgi:hypothetical protein